MPVFDTLRKLACCAARERDEQEATARRPLPLPVAAGSCLRRNDDAAAGLGSCLRRNDDGGAGLGSCLRRNDEMVAPGGEMVAPGRPYRDFVEAEARKYWEAMVKVGTLKKPGQRELRAAAMPVLGKALRRRRGQTPGPGPARYRARQAVNVMQNYAIARDWVMPPYTLLSKYAAHEDALLQLADDAGWLYREIPLPEHPDPQHPPIHYTLDPVTRLPVPTEDSLIRGDYVYDPADGSRLTQADHIYPWQKPDITPTAADLTARGWDACYKFKTSRTHSWDRPWDARSERFVIMYFWKNTINPPLFRSVCDRKTHLRLCFTDYILDGVHFSSRPPTPEQLTSYRRKAYLLFGIDS